MIKNELQALWHNKLLVVVLIAIMLIPAMYAGLFLSSMWDPYGDLEYLPVAVVNRDKPVTYNDKELTIGEDLAENLRKNDSMAFNVVDADTAREGLEKGTYYMVITIPENFSECASSLMENPKKMMLDFETNPGRNYISMKLSESAMKEIRANLREEVTRTYTETVFDSLKEVEDGFADAVAGTDEMLDGEDKLLDGNNRISENLLLLSNGASTLNASMGDLTSGTGKLLGGVREYTDGVGQLDSGLLTINNGSKSLSDGAKEVSGGVDKLAGGLNKLTASVGQNIKEQEKSQKKYKKDVDSDKKNVTGAVTSYATDVATASATAAATDAAGAAATVAATQAAGAAATVAAGEAGTVAAGVAADKAGTAAAGAAVSTVLSTVKTTIPNVPAAFIATYGAENVAAMDANTLLTKYTEFLGGMLNNMAADPATNEAVAGAVTAAVSAAVTPEVVTGAVATKMQSSETQEKITQAVTAKMQSSETQQKITQAVASRMQSSETQEKIRNAVGGVDTKTVTETVSVLANDAGQLGGATGALTVLNTIDEQTDLSQLPKLVEGAKAVAEGASSLNAGIAQAKSGSQRLSDSSDALNGGAGALDSGARKVSDAVGEISDGSGKLADGSLELGEGLLSLKDGTQTLHDGLSDGKDELGKNEVTDDSIDMFVAPVDISETQITKVENNGHAMAAYMFSVGLWVGCLAFCLMYPLARHTGELTNGRAWWASKAVVLYPLSILMVVLLLAIMHFAVGFHPGSMFRTFVMALAVVACFMSIMYFFNLLLGKVGSFLMLLFMVLQLTGSAGTYPIEVSGKLAQGLHKWMPFTYSVDGFRAAIAEGGPSIVEDAVVLFVISIFFTLLTVLVFRVRTKLSKENRRFLYDWLEEKGLA